MTTVPTYDPMLTQKNWDKNKGSLAKMAGYTGMGDALRTLEADYKKVDWTVFDMQVLFPRGSKDFTLPKLEKAMEAAVKDAKAGAAAKLRASALETRDTALKTEKDYKANKLVPKAATALCASIAKAAEQLSVAANANSVGGYVSESAKLVRGIYDVTAANIKKSYGMHLNKLAVAFAPVVRDTSYAAWRDAGIMTLARNLNQQVGNVGNLAEKGYDVGMNTGECDKFFKDMNLYGRVAVPFEENASETDRKGHARAMLLLLKRGTELQ